LNAVLWRASATRKSAKTLPADESRTKQNDLTRPGGGEAARRIRMSLGPRGAEKLGLRRPDGWRGRVAAPPQNLRRSPPRPTTKDRGPRDALYSGLRPPSSGLRGRCGKELARHHNDPYCSQRRAMRDGGSMGIGIGIIGAGHVAEAHLAAYDCLAPVSVAAIADVDRARASMMGERFRIGDAVTDYRQLLERTDIAAVSICTPARTHTQITLDSIAAGKHVLCEKPLATSLDDCDAVADAASLRPGQVVSCVFQHREDPAIRRAKWALERGELGSLASVRVTARACRDASYFKDGRGSRANDGGGALMTQGIHALDALIWLLGEVTDVSAVTDTQLRDIDAEDTMAGWARLANGMQVSIESSTCAQRDQYELEIFGEKAMLRLSYLPGWARQWKMQVRSAHRRDAAALRFRAERQVPPATRVRALHGAALASARVLGSPRRPKHLGHGPHIRRFLESVRGGRPAPVPPIEARRSVELALAFYRSAATGEIVRLPLCRASARRA
jgi:UDP-N-acetyl-2-amino-2-deoxyglucuronate dehydrogenase